MAIVNAINYAKTLSEPSEKQDKGDLNGRIKHYYDEYIFPADVFAANDEINLMELPAGARIIEATLWGPSLGTTGIFALGHRLSGSDVEDGDAFIAAADFRGQAAKAQMPAGSAGALKKFESAVQLYLEATEATDSAAGDKIQVSIQYVLD